MATRIRYQVLAATTVAAVLLYLDRVCIAEIVKLASFRQDVGLTEGQAGVMMSAFFLTYALSQVPAGLLSDKFGARQMLPLYICVWSLCTLATGLATGFAMLIVVRLLFGIAQAGCYPTAGSLIRRWVPLSRRGTASSIVSFGGRLGGTIAPLLTAWLLQEYFSWRVVLGLYGVIGFAVAAYFWWICRETPEAHPGCDVAEQQLIRGHEAPDQPETRRLPLVALLTNGSMWLMSLLQFGINLGWAFLVTWLPTYLQDVKQVDPKVGGLMSTVVLAAGVIGMLCGGPLTDLAAARLGKRWGRTLPMLACYTIAVITYLTCIRLESPYAFLFAFSLIAFVTDLSVPSIWAYMQDVGGKDTAAYFGWGNMWGNLGAATTPLLVPIVRYSWDTNQDWHEAFFLFSAGYLVAAICAIFIRVRPASTPVFKP